MKQKYIETLKKIAQYVGLPQAELEGIVEGGEIEAEKKYLEILDVIAEKLGLSQATVDSVIRTGEIEVKKKYFETQDEVAEYLGFVHSTVNRLIKNREIKGTQVGTGEKRTHLQFSVDELDRYQMTRMKKRLGNKFEKEFSEAHLVVNFFRQLNTDLVIEEMLKGKEFDEAMRASRIGSRSFTPEDFETVCPESEIGMFTVMHILFLKFHKDVRCWIKNQLIQAPIITQVIHHPQKGQEMSERDKKANEIYLRYNKKYCLIIAMTPAK